MKTLILHSNHGNHEGHNRKWSIVEKFNRKKDASRYLKGYLKAYKENLENSLYRVCLVTKKDYDQGFFNGGANGYASSEIREFFEKWN